MTDSIQNHDGEVPVDLGGAAQTIGFSSFFLLKHSSGKKAPLIPFFKIGNRLRFWPSDLRAYLAARSKKD